MWFGVRIRPVGIVILGLLTLLGVGSAAMRFSAPLLSALLNVGLPEAWQVNFTQAITHANRATHLPQVVLRYHDCPLLTLEQVTLPWQRSPTIRVASATVDYVCFDTASPPSSPSMPWSFPTTFSLPAALAFVPQGNIVLDAVTWRNLPEQLPLLFREELAQPSQLRFAFSSSILTASLSHPSFQLDATWQTNGLALTAAYQWQLLEAPFQEPRLQAGQATLSLQTEASILHGELHVQSATEITNFLRLPFQLSAEGLQITQSRIPLGRGGIHAITRLSSYNASPCGGGIFAWLVVPIAGFNTFERGFSWHERERQSRLQCAGMGMASGRHSFSVASGWQPEIW